tara:strand:- start:25600 stop:27180 length:1581 start_codon:yes stop_codon:yes gene_type:complete
MDLKELLKRLPDNVPTDTSFSLEGFHYWDVGFRNFNRLTLLILIVLLGYYFLYKIILRDIQNKNINFISIPALVIPSFFYYILPAIFISLCTYKNLCFSIPNGRSGIDWHVGYFSGEIAEKFIFIKYFTFLSITILGCFIGLISFKKLINLKKEVKLKYLFNKCHLKEIKIKNKLGEGIFYTYICASFAFIFFKIFTLVFPNIVSSDDLYYVANFTRFYSYYDFLLYPPAFLIGFGSTKFKDLILLTIVIFIKSFVMYFCLGRTIESIYLGSLSLFLLNSSYFYKYKRNIINIIFSTRNRSAQIPFFIFLSGITSIFSTKLSELFKGLVEVDTFSNPAVYDGLAFYQIFGNMLGSPKMIYAHFINSTTLNYNLHDSFNIIISQFYKLIYPRYINTFLPDDFMFQPRYLSDLLLNFNIKEVGGSTFGSAFGLYSYSPILIACFLILLFSSLNFFIFYFISNKIQTILDSKRKDFSIRNYIYLLTALPFKATWGGGIFPTDLLWLLATYFIIYKFVHISNKIRFLENI